MITTLAVLIGTIGLAVPQQAHADISAPLPGNVQCVLGGSPSPFDNDFHFPGLNTATFFPSPPALNPNSNLVVRLQFNDDPLNANPAGGVPFVNAGLASLVDVNTQNIVAVSALAPDSLVNPTRTFAAVFNGIVDGTYDAVFCINLASQDDAQGNPLFPPTTLGSKHSHVIRVVLDNEAPVVRCDNGADPLVLNVLATQVPVPLNFSPELVAFLDPNGLFPTSPTAIDAIEGQINPVNNNAPAAGFPQGDTPVRFFASDSVPQEGEATCTVRVVVTPVPGCSGLGAPIGINSFCLDLNAQVPFCGVTVFPATLDLMTVGVGDITPNSIYTIHNSGNAHGRYVATFTGFIDPNTQNVVIDANHLRYIPTATDTPFLSMIEYSDVNKKVHHWLMDQ